MTNLFSSDAASLSAQSAATIASGRLAGFRPSTNVEDDRAAGFDANPGFFAAGKDLFDLATGRTGPAPLFPAPSAEQISDSERAFENAGRNAPQKTSDPLASALGYNDMGAVL